MPDPNKFAELREMDYVIRVTCSLCTSGRFQGRAPGESPGVGWGTCAGHKYQHGKHTGNPREVSIYFAGTCPDAELSPSLRERLGAHTEFLLEEG